MNETGCPGEFGEGHQMSSGAWCRVCGKNLAWEDTLAVLRKFFLILILFVIVLAVTLLLIATHHYACIGFHEMGLGSGHCA